MEDARTAGGRATGSLAALVEAVIGAFARLRLRRPVRAAPAGQSAGTLAQPLDETELDGTTGLPGHGVIHQRATAVLEQLADGEQAAILLLDVDGFRMLNDSFGQEAGDDLLAELARRLGGAVRDGDVVARVGADEFAIFCERIDASAEATGLARRLLATLASPFSLDGQQVSIGARVGIAVSGPTGRHSGDLMRDADLAMAQARATRSRWAVFRPEMREASRRFLATASDLRRARGRNQLRVEYQPIVALPGAGLTSFEALVRWAHPQRGLIPPAEFIPVAEQAGLISEIGEWVLREALAAAVRWGELAGEEAPHVAVNVSAQQLADPDFVYTVTRCVGETQLPPERLILEVTESAVMENVEAAVESLRVLKGLGSRIALDDFGAGASSLAQLRQLRWVDILKIDKSFADGITDAPENEAIVRTVIQLARALDMCVVAEGIESEAQAQLLIGMGCDFAQGFHFGRPLRPTAADARIVSSAHAWAT